MITGTMLLVFKKNDNYFVLCIKYLYNTKKSKHIMCENGKVCGQPDCATYLGYEAEWQAEWEDYDSPYDSPEFEVIRPDDDDREAGNRYLVMEANFFRTHYHGPGRGSVGTSYDEESAAAEYCSYSKHSGRRKKTEFNRRKGRRWH